MLQLQDFGLLSQTFGGGLHGLVSRTAACCAAAFALGLGVTANEGPSIRAIGASDNSMQIQLSHYSAALADPTPNRLRWPYLPEKGSLQTPISQRKLLSKPLTR